MKIILSTFLVVCSPIFGFTQTFTSIKGPLTTYHDIIKDNSGTLFVASHTKGVFTSTDGGQNWAGLGGNSIGVGQINALAFGASNQLLAATEQGGVKIWNGTVWTAVNTGLPTNCGVLIPIRTIAVDAAGNYYAGAHSYTSCFTTGDLYKYNGSTWTPISSGMDNKDINTIAVSPVSATVFAGTDAGVFAYNGSTWSAVNANLGSLVVNKLTFSSAGDLFAATNAGVFKLPNGAASWSALLTGLPADAIRSIAVDPVDPTHLVVGTGADFDQVGTLIGTLYQSINGGANWAQVGATVNSTAIRSVLFTANNTVFAAGWGLFRSTDNGTTWTSAKTGLSGSIFNTNGNIAVTASPDRHLFYGTDEGVFKSSDGGVTWQPANVGLTRHNVSLLKCDSQGNLFCAVWRYLGVSSVGFGDGILYKSKDDGATWIPVNIAKDWRYLEMAELPNGNLICSHGFGSQLPLATVVGSSLAVSHDHGSNWTDLNVLSGLGYCTAANAAGNMFVAGESNGVYRSTDGGNSFSLHAIPGLNSNVGLIEVSPTGDLLVGAGGQRTLRYSTDSGVTYTNFISAVLPDYKGVTDIIFDNTGKAYCTTSGQGVPSMFTISPPFSASSVFVPVAGLQGTYFKMVWDDCGYLYVYSPGVILKSTVPFTVSTGLAAHLSSPLNDVSPQEYRILSAATINAVNTLFNGSMTSYTGTKSITLTAGFDAKAGSVFKAAVGGCGY